MFLITYVHAGDGMEIKYATLTNCKLQQVGSEFSRKPYAVAVQTGHPLKEHLSASYGCWRLLGTAVEY